MESAVFQQSPLAEYLEGQGEASPVWQPTQCDVKPESPNMPSFAPRGPRKPGQSRVQKLLSPLRIQGRRRARTLTAVQDVCSAAVSLRVSTTENERFLDQFRYIIIASQLLVHEANTTVEPRFSSPLGHTETLQYNADNSFSLQGAAATTAISFSAALTLHWAREQSSIHWLNVCILLALALIVVIGIYGYARRKTSQRTGQAAMGALSDLITQSRAMDSVVRSALGLIQEVEIVSRGYEISNPLPPISRLEMTGIDRRCRVLRSGVVNAINSTIHCYLEAHNVMLPLVDSVDMQRYHDIYELPRQDYQEMIQGLPSTVTDDPESLGGLRMSMLRLFVARQILFCDLLALPSESSVPGTNRWTLISDEIASLSQVVGTSATSVGLLIDEEENRHWGDQSRGHSQESVQADESQGPEVVPPRTPAKEKVHAQFRRLDALSRSIRSLNARMLLMRDEANSLIEGAGHNTDITSVLAKQYDLVGSDLRNLMSEWERGRNTMLLGIGAVDRSSLSRSSSELRSPHSPVHSLGGITAVTEGSPAEALRRLTEEGLKAPSNDGLGSDEEIFEAVALPPKPKRLSMTREEKLAKMQEDRRKRATLQESRDASTNMLRELETVIKHRPRGRTTSRIISV